jgi:hypothetical protein
MAPWITVLSRHTVFTKRVIYRFTFVWSIAKQGTVHRPTSHLAHLYTALSLATRRTQLAAQLGWWFRWPVFVMVTLQSQNIFCARTWSSNQSGGWASAPHFESVSATKISLMASSKFFFPPAIAQYPQSYALFRLLCVTGHICRNVIPVRYEHLLQWEQNRSKAAMWLLYKIPAIRGCPRRCY